MFTLAMATEWMSIDKPMRTGAAAENDVAVVIGNENYPRGSVEAEVTLIYRCQRFRR